MLSLAIRAFRRPLHTLRLLLAALAGILLAACGSDGGSRPATPPDEVERFGALELVTHLRAERGGDAAHFAWQYVAHWSLRWQGQPLVIDTLGGLFGDQPRQVTRINAAFVVKHAGRLPDLVVNVGEAENTSAFHLMRQRGDTLARAFAVHRERRRQHVHDTGFHLQPGKPGLPGEPGDPQMQVAFMRRLGEAFDAELASGQLDHLFTAAPAAAR
jgi:hypothetical protein